jgi:hypothetical protein
MGKDATTDGYDYSIRKLILLTLALKSKGN